MPITLNPTGKESLDKFFDTLARSGTLPAFAAGATSADAELYFKTAGKKLVNDNSSEDVNADSVFWICSMTKLVTHISALQLIEQGKLSEETPVAEILPQMKNPVLVADSVSRTPEVLGPIKTVLRVKHLLNHSSGLFYRYSPNFGIYHSDEYGSVHDPNDPHSSFFNTLKGNLPGVPLKFEPETDFAYGYSADALGFVVEKASGKTLEDYMQENIFGPLGIMASFYLTPELKEKLVPLSLRDSDGRLEALRDQPGYRIIPQDPSQVSCHLGGIGLYTSLRDYLSFLRHLLQIYSGKAENPILKLETVKSLFVPTLTEEGCNSINFITSFTSPVSASDSWSNALAVNTQDWPGRRKKNSDFWSGWAGTHYWIDPTTGVAGVFGVQLVCATSGAGDSHVVKAFDTLEETLYDGLEI
ncbi:hypothetical protein D9619_008157 [Psilocybe cf. subviscida]|uniref:Beta-lactamase-related domain-containing protein n=1 Tax=Psilocybe cf. subviscida TaxID=2480587 RepID=A0A8H5AVK6_9AGAR|nr:hypothetical protein D9619_008157 [Psilocybe cf. subviscida]